MKRYISLILCLCLAASVLLLGACGKKHTIDTDVALDGGESLSGSAGVVYENVTDAKGENVTNAEGETVTVAVPVETTSAQEEASSTKAGETTAKPSEATTKKGETTTKKNETTTKKGETTTKNETTTKKAETTTKKEEATTKKQESTQPSTTQPQKVVVNPGDYQFDLRADKTEVSPGDTVTVTLKLKNCKNVACFNIFVKCAARKGSVETEKFKSNRFTDDDGNNFDIYSNNESAETINPDTVEIGALFGGMPTATYSFIGDDLCTVTFKVTSQAKSGDTLVFSAVPKQFLVSSDETGTYTENIFSDVETVPVMVTVK